MATIKLRYIDQRYTEDGRPEMDPFQPGKVLVNHGGVVVVQGGIPYTYLPGDSFDIEESEGRALCARMPKAFMLESAWEAFLAKLNRAKPNREAARKEHQRMLEERQREQQAADRLRVMIAQRDEEARKAAQLATEAEVTRRDKDAISVKLEQMLALMAQQQAEAQKQREEQAQRIAELEAKLTAQSEKRGRKPAPSEPVTE